MGTSQAQLCVQWFGKPADELQTACLDWPELPLKAEGDNYTMPQADQDRFATRPLWTPVYASPASASNSAYYYSHATSETARVVFEHGLWPAAVAIWRSEEHTSELQSQSNLVCRLLLEKKKNRLGVRCLTMTAVP